jgi:predicted TPR repeat methyltransferase
MNAAALLQQALQAHQQGLLDEAAKLYREVLAHNPRQFDALHLLGVIARQRGDAAGAASLIRDALQVDPSQARAHCNLGAALQDLGDAQAALDSYDRALRLDPRYVLAWDNRGNALRRLGRLDDALHSYEQALGLRHDAPDAWCHRAIVLNDLGRFDDAITSATHALQVRPDWPDALLALGNALQALERVDEACAAYDRALAQTPQRADIWCARGSALKKAGGLEAALASYDRALALDPGYALAQHYRANTLRALGRKPEAIAAYRAALLLGADAAGIGFALAALGEGAVPASAPPDYIKGLFDQYAGHFDQHLVEVLAYRTPALLDELLRAHVTGMQDEVLDLGCGTGLCAPFLRPLARRLTGVDLSQRMLDKARASGHYDALVCADIVEFLTLGVQVDPQAGPQMDHYGLVLAADVFVYIGDLAAVFAGVARALRSGGWFAFSVEAPAEGDDGTGYAITPSNRFTHAPAYIARLAADKGFTTVETRAAALRREHGRDVAGQLVLLRRTCRRRQATGIRLPTAPSSRSRPAAPAPRRAPPCGRWRAYRRRA